MYSMYIFIYIISIYMYMYKLIILYITQCKSLASVGPEVNLSLVS